MPETLFEKPQVVQSYVMGEWYSPVNIELDIHDAVYGKLISHISSDGIDVSATLDYGRQQNKSSTKYRTLQVLLEKILG